MKDFAGARYCIDEVYQPGLSHELLKAKQLRDRDCLPSLRPAQT